jgi:hypothetical protein
MKIAAANIFFISKYSINLEKKNEMTTKGNNDKDRAI